MHQHFLVILHQVPVTYEVQHPRQLVSILLLESLYVAGTTVEKSTVAYLEVMDKIADRKETMSLLLRLQDRLKGLQPMGKSS